MKLKFSKPKKDLCGICETYRQGNEEAKNKLRERYTKHIAEKEAIRRLKDGLKAEEDPSHVLASFDLQQVIYLPKSNRCEIFYKRRLSNYNFTVYNIKSKDVECYLWNESIAARGANEVSSCIHQFLKHYDREGLSKISLFADGCSGQNKNSILPIMLHDFIQNSKFIQEITVYYFETNHGQNEGDSVHSSVEKALKRAHEIILPSELVMLIRLARRNPMPYSVIQIEKEDIYDWKSYSQQIGVLRVRASEEGQNIEWTSVMQLKVQKDDGMKLFFKHSHLESNFLTLNIGTRRNSLTSLVVEKAYTSAPKISIDKFNDLQALCNGETPVINTEEARKYYRNLYH